MVNQINFSGFSGVAQKMLYPNWASNPDKSSSNSLLECVSKSYSSISLVTDGFQLEIDSGFVQPWISYEINRLTQKVLLQIFTVNGAAKHRLSNSWNLVSNYYLAFYLCQSYQRFFGKLVTQFPSRQVATNAEQSAISLIDHILGIDVSGSAYKLTIARQASGVDTITCNALGKGNTHKHNWGIFSEITKEIAPKPSRVLPISDIKMVSSLKLFFEGNSQWPSDLRNSVNYQLRSGYLEFGESAKTFPSPDIIKRNDILERLQRTDKEKIRSPRLLAGVDEKAQALNSMTIPLLWYSLCLWSYQYHRSDPACKLRKEATRLINTIESLWGDDNILNLCLEESK